MHYKIIEKQNPLAVHAECHTKQSAQAWIERYGDSKMFMDKTLTKESFEIISCK